jgi:hypothetical protein
VETYHEGTRAENVYGQVGNCESFEKLTRKCYDKIEIHILKGPGVA